MNATLIVAILGGLRFAPQAIPWLVGLTITAASGSRHNPRPRPSGGGGVRGGGMRRKARK
jgi:hypothetical protein